MLADFFPLGNRPSYWILFQAVNFISVQNSLNALALHDFVLNAVINHPNRSAYVYKLETR